MVTMKTGFFGMLFYFHKSGGKKRLDILPFGCRKLPVGSIHLFFYKTII